MVSEGEPLPDVVRHCPLLTSTGASTELDVLLDGAPGVVFVVRHFGCAGCDRHIRALRPHLSTWVEVGLRVVVVGNGDLPHAAWFAERHRLDERDIRLVTDASMAFHDALDLHRSLWSSFGPRGASGWLAAWSQGHRQVGFFGDHRHQGGALVVDADGVVRFVFRSRATGDDPRIADVGRVALSLASHAARSAGYREIV